MKQNNKNKIGIAIMLIAIVLFAGAVTYAFFSADVTGTQEKLTVTTGNLALTFADNNTGVSGRLNFGESVTKTFTIQNTGDRSAEAQISWKNLVNLYKAESLTYTLEQSTSETGTYNTVETMSKNVPRSETPLSTGLSKGLVIPAGATYYYTLTITLEYLADVDQTGDIDAMFNSEFDINLYTPTALDKIMLSAKSGNPDFEIPATTDEGIYTMADDYGTSYYYRGAVTNNYVKFVGFYWRIIRVNGDGSLRMIYDGTVAHKNGEGNEIFTTTGVNGSTTSEDRFALTEVAWNTTSKDDTKYVGYMYGGANGSTSGNKADAQKNETNTNIKTQVESWYKTNIVDTNYDNYVADAIYCNDRSMGGSDSTYTNLGYGSTPTNYAARTRFNSSASGYTDATPTFKCAQANDMFTKTTQTINGKTTNGKLEQKVGLITADEIVAAGSGKYNTANRNYYLYKSSDKWYWSLSPYYFIGSKAYMFTVSANSHLGNYIVDYSGAVAPVISIKANYVNIMTGTGTSTDPYTIPGAA